MAHLQSAVKQLAFDGTANVRTYDGLPAETLPAGKAIKLWDRSIIPLEGVSTTHEDYKAYPVAPPAANPRAAYTANPHKLQSVTTNQASYPAWPLEVPPAPAPVPAATNPHRSA